MWTHRAAWLYSSIREGELRDHEDPDDARFPVTLEALGTLALPGGRLVAADPYVMADEPTPFTQTLGADEAEVVVARALIGEGHERVAALILLVAGAPISDWVMATLPGQDTAAVGSDDFFGYGVDAGTGSFGGPEAMVVAGRVLGADAGMLEDPISEALFADGLGTRSAVIVAPEDGATPIAACSSGWGDGLYSTWFGIDDNGGVSVVVTDFQLAGDPYSMPVEPDEAPAQPAPPAPPAPRKSLLRRLFGS